MKHIVPVLTSVVASVFIAHAGLAETPYYQPQVYAEGFYNPEGPVLDSDGNLYVAEVWRTTIHRVTPDGTVSLFLDTGYANNATTFDADGNLVIANQGMKAILRVDNDGAISVITATSDGDSLLGPNDMAWGAGGRLYFTDPGSPRNVEPVGGVHYIAPDGTTKRFTGGLIFPNGIAFNADRTILYINEGKAHRILRYEVNPDGSAGEMTVFCNLPEEYTLDGMKVDVEGNLWAAQYDHGEVWLFSPAGEKIRSVKMPTQRTTNMTFGGDDMKTMYITCPDERRNPTGKVFTMRVPVAGLPTYP